MKTKLEKLNLKKFESSEMFNTRNILGGVSSIIPDGGASCDTNGGSNDCWAWDNDIDTYNADGSFSGKDMGGGRRLCLAMPNTVSKQLP